MIQGRGYIHRKATGGYKLDLSGKDLFLEQVSMKIGKGRKTVRVLMTLKEDSDKSSAAMRYYRGVIIPMVAIPYFKKCGDVAINNSTAHLRLKYIVGFTEEVVNVRTGEVQELPRSLSDANKDELSEFIEDVIHFLEDAGEFVPRPDEYYENQLSIG